MKTSCSTGSTISLNHLTRMSIFMVIRAQLTHIITKEKVFYQLVSSNLQFSLVNCYTGPMKDQVK